MLLSSSRQSSAAPAVVPIQANTSDAERDSTKGVNSVGASACANSGGRASLPRRVAYPASPNRCIGSVPRLIVRMPLLIP